jgi:hypothetical protein
LGKRCGSGGCFHSGWRGQKGPEEKAARGTEAILEMGGGAVRNPCVGGASKSQS